MCGPRQTENGRDDRQEAEVTVWYHYYLLPRGLLLDQLKHTEQGKITAAELVMARRHAVIHSIINCVGCHGRLVRHRRYAIPAARIRDTYEQRKRPQPHNGSGEEFAMAM